MVVLVHVGEDGGNCVSALVLGSQGDANRHELQPISGEKTNSQGDKTSVADEYERRQRDEIARVLTACRGAWVAPIVLLHAWA